MKKIGIIRCMQTEDICPGTTDFSFAAQGKGAFEELGPCEVIGFVSCGGCPGKRAVARARMLVDRGAEAVALASCICKGNPISFPCPHHETMIAAIRKNWATACPCWITRINIFCNGEDILPTSSPLLIQIDF